MWEEPTDSLREWSMSGFGGGGVGMLGSVRKMEIKEWTTFEPRDANGLCGETEIKDTVAKFKSLNWR